jgi:hypothetical protein
MDLSKLSDDQLQIAFKVADEAKRQGINPDFVLPMVMIESGFNPKATSKAGALGVMQLMPDTAKSLNVDPHDVDQNISGGVGLIKQLIQNKNIGNDPYKVLTGYNAGPSSKYFETGNLQDLPDETVNHMIKVSDAYGGSLPQVSMTQPVGKVPSLPTEGKPLVTPDTSGSNEKPPEQLPVPVAALAGAKLGASAGAAASAAKGAKDIYEIVTGQNKPLNFSGETPGGKWGAKTGYGIGEGTVQESSSRYERAKPQSKIAGRMAKLYGVRKPNEPVDLVERMIARGQQAEQAAQMARPSRLQPFVNYVGKLASLPVKSSLYGAGIAANAADVYNRIKQKDYGNATLSGAGGVAGAVAPFVSSMGALPAIAAGVPAYLAASDRLEHLKKHPEDYQLQETSVDPMGNIQSGGLP